MIESKKNAPVSVDRTHKGQKSTANSVSNLPPLSSPVKSFDENLLVSTYGEPPGSPDKFKNLRLAQELLFTADSSEWSRFSKCHSCNLSSFVGVRRNKKDGSSYYNGVVQCGSVWVCPVCSAKIASKRCEELKKGVEFWLYEHVNARENTCYHLVLTHSHKRDQSLRELLAKQGRARQSFWADWSVKNAFRKIGYAGRVSSFEVTVSNFNGWHPHQHILVFARKISENDLNELETLLKSKWLDCLRKHGLDGDPDIALRIDRTAGVENYITKMSNELSLSHVKTSPCSRVKHYPPFALLTLMNSKPTEKLYFWALNKWLEYAEAFKGRTQLSYSRGLKNELALNDVSDDQLLIEDNVSPDYEDYFAVSSDDFKKLRTHKLLGHVLNLVAKDDFSSIRSLFEQYNIVFVQHKYQHRYSREWSDCAHKGRGALMKT